MASDEIELRDYLTSMGKRKWLVIGLTLAAAFAAAAADVIIPRESAVESMIRVDLPAEVGIEIRQIADTINRSSRDGMLPSILKLNPDSVPSVEAEVSQVSPQLRLLIRGKDLKAGTVLVEAIVRHLNTKSREKLRQISQNAEPPDSLQVLSIDKISRSLFISKTWLIGLAALFGFLFSTLLAYVLECRKNKKKAESTSHE